MICRHCQQAIASRPRRLCWSCYYTPGVKERYSPVSSHCRGLGVLLPLGLPAPTSVAPGPEKVPVLEIRAELRLELWHPLDFVPGDEWTAGTICECAAAS